MKNSVSAGMVAVGGEEGAVVAGATATGGVAVDASGLAVGLGCQV